MKRRYIEGILQVVTPLHIAGETGDQNTIYTTRMDIFGEDGRSGLPYFPGNDLRGRMRRKAAYSIMDVVKPVPMHIFHGLTCGANTTSLESGAEDIGHVIKSRADLYLGLFGGGSRLHRSGMQVRNLIPVTGSTLQLGMVPSRFESIIGGRYSNDKIPGRASPYLTTRFKFLKIDDVMKCTDLNAPDIILDYNQIAVEHSQSVTDNRQQRKAEKAASEAAGKGKRAQISVKHESLTNMYAIEAMCPGTPLYLRIDFDEHLTDAQVAFAARALEEVLSTPIGGKVAAGFGVVRPVEGSVKLVTNGESIDLFQFGESDMFVVNPAIPGYDDCEGAVGSYTLESLEELFPLPSKTEQKGKAASEAEA